MRRHIEFDRLHNFRDIGGYRTTDGKTVRWKRLYRADTLSRLQGKDWQRFLSLEPRTVIDLRYPWEITRDGRVPDYPGLGYHNLSIEHRPYDQAAQATDVDPVPYLAARYAEVAEDGATEIRRALELIANQENAPTVVHCTSGKDRTGLISALVLSLLGVSEEDIATDYALTNLATPHLITLWRTSYPDKTHLWPGYGQAPATLMRLFLANLAEAHGSVRGYVTKRLGLPEESIDTLRGHLLAEPSC
ncbi:tyrosine-protein phosphatase [Actinokineospora iranica]|uniref:Protein-tyrosine phosphatase n=1 Tax=Actinokineospora iranica TaxID=1271860 RepID=A0A1G6YL72_9PSEU|nr:tyrosine-protein phosphatase [Actinokineospora iranica]SDD90385.1 protein-tyrosine phosphatase [Actinokineospora iranica]